jgi:hypothetical protein
LEMNVGGRIDAAGNISGGAWLDGYQVRAGQVVLIDRKDWKGFVPKDAANQSWWSGPIVEEGRRQVDATAGTGAAIEWQASTIEARDEIRRVIARNPQLAGRIDVVHVPKK